MKKALVLISGGLDSLAVLAGAKQTQDEIHTVVFEYGQRNSTELSFAWHMSQEFGVASHNVINISSCFTIMNSAMLDRSVDLAPHASAPGLGNHYVPNRNIIFLGIAHGYAEALGCDSLFVGMGGTAPGGAPDSEPEFIEAAEVAIKIGNPSAVEIIIPLYGMTKDKVWELIDRLGVMQYAIENTLSCHNGDHVTKNVWGPGCASCPACKLRATGYHTYMDKGLI